MSDVQPALVRQWRLLRQLSARPEGLSLRELAREVEVSQKTIHRDLQLFQRAGFPLHEIGAVLSGTATSTAQRIVAARKIAKIVRNPFAA